MIAKKCPQLSSTQSVGEVQSLRGHLKLGISVRELGGEEAGARGRRAPR